MCKALIRLVVLLAMTFCSVTCASVTPTPKVESKAEKVVPSVEKAVPVALATRAPSVKPLEPPCDCPKIAQNLRDTKLLYTAWSTRTVQTLNGILSDTLRVDSSDIARSFLARNEVILVGDRANLNRVVSRIASEAPAVAFVQIGDSVALDIIPGGWEMRLYRLRDAFELGQVVTLILGWRNEPGYEVMVDPNHLIGTAEFGSLSGSDWYIEGSPSGVGAGQASENDFTSQWAFGNSGIGLPPSGSGTQGRGVDVYVFDTSPLSKTAGDSSLNLQVDYTAVSGYTPKLGQPCSVVDHGLFVASLIHQVAPGSTIHLYQVLNEYAMGSLYDLNLALIDLLKKIKKPPEANRVVMNLSLGVRNGSLPPNVPPTISNTTWLSTVETLDLFLGTAYNRGAVIVAAAGNKAEAKMEVPAAYTYTLGVRASNISGTLSCYPNQAGPKNGRCVAAPGGDGKSVNDCKPWASECSGSKGQCNYGVVGRVTGGTGYAYWSGTSFAAPLVSGLAARCLDKGVPNAGKDIAEGVYSRIESCAGGRGGVIKVGACGPCSP